MLIDVSYFVEGPRHIQNASTSKTAGADSLAVTGHIEAYIKELQPVFLEAMLGEKKQVMQWITLICLMMKKKKILSRLSMKSYATN